MTLIYLLLGLIILLQAFSLFKNKHQSTNEALTAIIQLPLASIEKEINRVEFSVKEELRANRAESTQLAGQSRRELNESLESFRNGLNTSLRDFSDRQRENFSDLNKNQESQNRSLSERILEMKVATEGSLKELQVDNARKLDEMRATVDEKLQKTLESRLSESFKQVSERLEAVHKGLGDMQQLATGVGDLKKVLSNVKTRGMLGEYQLENLLEQILTTEQYAKNVKPRPGSNAIVEFAIKLPGNEDKKMPVWLPIDAKFPKEDFEHLLHAYDSADLMTIEECRKIFIRGIRKCAADISSKYIESPYTTDFALLFLPFESLYAEVLRTPGLFESIQREYKIIITGPTTLSALLSSLQMGFRTLAIEKRSSEVWNMLSSVKSEFGKFGIALQKTKKKLQEASNVIEEAEGRSRQVEKKLQNVQLLPEHEIASTLPNSLNELEPDTAIKEADQKIDKTNSNSFLGFK